MFCPQVSEITGLTHVANNERDAGKERFWRSVLKRQAGSRLSVRAFCERERLTESAFYAWRRTIQERDAHAARAKQQPAFLPLVVRESATFEDRHDSHAAIEIALAGNRVLRLPGSIEPHRVAAIVAALDATAADAAEATR
jgi:hypothetical protein